MSRDVRHPGILVFPQPPRLAPDQAAILLDRFVRDRGDIANRFFAWEVGIDWREEG